MDMTKEEIDALIADKELLEREFEVLRWDLLELRRERDNLRKKLNRCQAKSK